MDAQLPPQENIVIKSSIESSTTSSSFQSESNSDSEGKTSKSFTVNEALDTLQKLNNLSEEQLPQLEKAAKECAEIRKKAIAEQEKTNQLLKQLSKHLESFQITQKDINALKETSDNFSVIINNNKEQIIGLNQTIDTLKQNITALTKEKEKMEENNHSLYRKVQLYMTGSVAILAVSFWIWWKSYHV